MYMSIFLFHVFRSPLLLLRGHWLLYWLQQPCTCFFSAALVTSFYQLSCQMIWRLKIQRVLLSVPSKPFPGSLKDAKIMGKMFTKLSTHYYCMPPSFWYSDQSGFLSVSGGSCSRYLPALRLVGLQQKLSICGVLKKAPAKLSYSSVL